MSSATASTGAPRSAARTALRAGARRPAAAAVDALPVPGPAPEVPPRRGGSLRIVGPAPSPVARGPFVALVLVVLAAGLLGLLLLNTVLAHGSFRLHELQVSTKQLGDQQQGLQREVDALQAPAALAAEAQRQGMVPGGPPAFLRLTDGAVLGQPTPAAAPTPTVTPSTSSSAPTSSSAASSSASSSASSAAATATPSTRATASAAASAKATPKAAVPPKATPKATARATPSPSAAAGR
ncbi:MAG TPA: hypothetical protein VFR07_10720 [Mycobacteriales bacterium]|jgi:hypothetical protein|nr:hypothetical protein [Mycobacteriales bacterium]